MQTVKKLKKWVLSSFDNLTDSQHKLVTTSKDIEDDWHRKEYVEDTSVVEAWCTAFREELLFQLGPSSASERKSLSESAMGTTLDAANVLSRNAGPESERCFAENEIVPLLTRYLIQSGTTMPRKVRDGCCTVLTTITSTHPALLTELLQGVLPELLLSAETRVSPTTSTPRSRDPTSEAGNASPPFPQLPSSHTTSTPGSAAKQRVTAQQVHLATLLVSALSKAVAALNPEPPHWLEDPAVLALADNLVSSTGRLVGNAAAVASAASTQPTTPSAASLSRAGSPNNNFSTPDMLSKISNTGEAGVREDSETAAVVVYTALIGCLCRGQSDYKLHLLRTRSHTLVRSWHGAVQRLSRFPRTVCLGSSKDGVVALEPVSFWQASLVEMLLELTTEGCFTQCRLRAFAEASRGEAGRRHHAHEARFEPLPAHWDTLLTGGGSLSIWLLAALLPTCPLMEAGIPLLQESLIGLDTSNPYAETVYRSLVCSLMLFCAGNPCVAATFAHHGMLDVLIAMLTYQQQSVFPSTVEIHTYSDSSLSATSHSSRTGSKDEEHGGVDNTSLKLDTTTHNNNNNSQTPGPTGGAIADAHPCATQVISPVAQLNSNTAQLTSSFISSLSALSFPTRLLRSLMTSVEAMGRRPTCQTDIDLIESLLYVLATTYLPTHILFFSGSGSVVCNAHRFVGRWSGYSFSAWINPICVWPSGSLLFSVTDHTGGTTELVLVANGRACCLALRFSHKTASATSGAAESIPQSAAAPTGHTSPSPVPGGASAASTGAGPALLIIAGSTMQAESWSHVAFTHGLVDPHVYVNGKRLDIPVSLPFPKEASRRHRLRVALGGLVGENSFVGLAARMDVLDGGLSDSDITKLFEAGPAKAAANTGYHTLLSLRCHDAPLPTDTGSLHRRASDTVTAATSNDSPGPEPVTTADTKTATTTTTAPTHADPRAEDSPPLATDATESEALVALPGSPVCFSGSLVGKGEGISVHGIIPFVTMDMKAVFAECDVVDWALRTLQVSPYPDQFITIARLCVCFITTPMRMAQTMAEREQCLHGGAALETLHAQILLWPDTYADLPSTLLSAVTIPGTGSRQLAAHPSTQTVITTLLDRLRVVSGELTVGVCPPDQLVRNPTSASSILRELSDCLLLQENVDVFLAAPGRFMQVLSLSLHLPAECTESVVMLIEKLCKGANELEATLRFLLATHMQLTAGQAKAEIVRMLFDVSRAKPSMCEAIGGCFKGTGLYFLLELIHGRNHHSEAIRVYALRLLSLILYTGKKQRETFLKNDGFALLRLAITDPKSLVPIRLPTLDCLFHMAFQSFRPTESIDAALATRLKSAGHPRTSSKLSHTDSVTPSAGGGGSSGGSASHRTTSHHKTQQMVASTPGHLPGLVARRLRVTHREFSFEVKRDFAARGAEDRWQTDDAYRGKGIEGSLTMPQALETALGVLGHLIEQSAEAFVPPAAMSRDGVGALSGSSAPSAAAAPTAAPSPVRAQENSESSGPALHLPGTVTAMQASSGDSTVSEEERPEEVVLPGLGYLEKIVDVQANAEALIRTSWLRWLWHAVSPVVPSRAGASATATATAASAMAAAAMTAGGSNPSLPPHTPTIDELPSPVTPSASPVPPHGASFSGSHLTRTATPTTQSSPVGRYGRRFSSEVLVRTRGIIRRVVALEMRLSSKAPTVRRLCGTLMPPPLVRIVLEETARYFSRTGHADLADPDTAANVIKNLDTLLEDVEALLVPFPSALGIELVTFVSTIAVNSNSWVRMRMKNSSSLFQTRDRFAFYLLCTMRKLTRVKPQQLIQLLDACTCNPNTMLVLLLRLQTALNAKDVNELERALLLIRHLAASDVEQSQQIAVLLDKRGAGLVELLTTDLDEDDNPLRIPSEDDSHLLDVGRSSSAVSAGTSFADVTALPALPTAQVVEWQQTHQEDYQVVSEGLRSAAKDIQAEVRAQEERVTKNRAALAKPTRVAEQRHLQEAVKLQQEFQRLVQTVQGERTRKNSS